MAAYYRRIKDEDPDDHEMETFDGAEGIEYKAEETGGHEEPNEGEEFEGLDEDYKPTQEGEKPENVSSGRKKWNELEVQIISAHLWELNRRTPQGRKLYSRVIKDCNKVRDVGTFPANTQNLAWKITLLRHNIPHPPPPRQRENPLGQLRSAGRLNNLAVPARTTAAQQQDLSDALTAIVNLNEDLEATQSELTRIEKQKEELDEQIETLMHVMKIHEKEIATLEQKRSVSKDELAKALREMGMMSEKHAAFKQELSELLMDNGTSTAKELKRKIMALLLK